ncbi:hypothetical protein J6590_020857 [Homalodisca vitripennis]|nr:hypothetical protein J6590_020857 [Homalodisca vitripennis]
MGPEAKVIFEVGQLGARGALSILISDSLSLSLCFYLCLSVSRGRDVSGSPRANMSPPSHKGCTARFGMQLPPFDSSATRRARRHGYAQLYGCSSLPTTFNKTVATPSPATHAERPCRPGVVQMHPSRLQCCSTFSSLLASTLHAHAALVVQFLLFIELVCDTASPVIQQLSKLHELKHGSSPYARCGSFYYHQAHPIVQIRPNRGWAGT